MFLFSLLLFTIYFFYDKSRKDAVFDLKLFNIKTFNIAVTGSIVGRLGIGGTTFLLPLLFQVGFGLSPFHAGLLISPIFVGMLSTKIFSRVLLKRYGFRKVLIINPAIIGLILMSFSLIQHTTPHIIIIALGFTYGVFVSMQFSSMNALNYVDIPPEAMSKATSIASTMMQLSSCFAVAITALLIKYFLGFQGLMLHEVAPLHHTFIVTGFITLSSVFLFRRLSDGDGAAVSGR
jgi:fucose permease